MCCKKCKYCNCKNCIINDIAGNKLRNINILNLNELLNFINNIFVDVNKVDKS